MARPQPPVSVSVGDPMPRITLPSASGSLFDSWDPMTWGVARAYWLGAPPAVSAAAQLADTLAACETLLHVVEAAPPEVPDGYPSWLLDRAGELGRAFGATGPLAIIVDAAGRVAALLPAPTPDGVAALATRLYMASTPAVVQAKAPVLLLERVAEPALCQTLIEYWQRGGKLANEVGSTGGNVVNADVKRRLDVQLDDPKLFVRLRDCLVRRVVPAMMQAFHARIMVIEAPRIGCYDAASGGWFRRHRDNTSSLTAHRQFALSLNLNADDEYDGGELRFPEFGRELYRPVAGGALVFSSSLLHEVIPVTRGRRFGVFTFLSASGPSVISGPSASRSASP
jgi:predicted 2-oxoglutarate/Fe(II)-dependent dioxygenase YbiX